ncbi:MAG: SGNH/GDSL hydrolase family protein [Streptosporangiaceae bacterium]
MVWRRVVLIVIAIGALVVPFWATAWGADFPPWGHVDSSVARSLVGPHRGSVPHRGLSPGALARCEAGLERGQENAAPRVAIVGASITAGVGPGNPDSSWAVRLARMEHWDAVIYGDPGAGYIRRGIMRQGPVDAELARVGLRALRPVLVIVQAGHNDIGEPLQLERQRVAQAIALIQAEAPQARIALLTVFGGRSHAARVYQTDQAIVTAALAADPGVIIMDPLTGRWAYPRIHDRLHPTADGDVQIELKVAEILREHGVVPAPAGSGGLICDSAVSVPRPL